MLRNTDVKKHLGRAVPRSVPVPAQNSNMPNDADETPQAIPVVVAADLPEKVENA